MGNLQTEKTEFRTSTEGGAPVRLSRGYELEQTSLTVPPQNHSSDLDQSVLSAQQEMLQTFSVGTEHHPKPQNVLYKMFYIQNSVKLNQRKSNFFREPQSRRLNMVNIWIQLNLIYRFNVIASKFQQFIFDENF